MTIRFLWQLLKDPRIFNMTIIALYAMNVVRWAFARRPADSIYWLGALIITLTVTFGYKH